jgi:uncharacterized protein YjbI with pentapeptide repeats
MKFRKIVITVLLLLSLTIAPIIPAKAEKPGDIRLLLNSNRCSYCDLSGIELSNLSLLNANLNNVDFSRTVLTEANLTKANLSSSDLSHANFQGIILQGANLSNSNLSGINLSNANLNEANLTNANLVSANLSGASLKNAKFSGFAGSAKLSLANLSHTNLQGSIFKKSSLVDVDFSDADLSNYVNLQGAILNGANLSRANLSGANLSEAHLSQVNLQGANLRGANLSKAVLSGADLRGADITNIKLDEAIFNKTLGLDTYAQQLFQQAVDRGNAGYYLTALNFLNKIPDETEVYSSAQKKKTQYIELQNQKELAAKEMFQKAENAAASQNYQEALNNLRAIPSETKVYSNAQKKIKEYKNAFTEIGLPMPQKVRVIGDIPESTKGANWPYVVNNAIRTSDEYATERNPVATFIGRNLQVEFIRQLGGEYEGRYVLQIVNCPIGAGVSFARLLPLFDEYVSSEELDDEGRLWQVILAKFDGREF